MPFAVISSGFVTLCVETGGLVELTYAADSGSSGDVKECLIEILLQIQHVRDDKQRYLVLFPFSLTVC